MDDIRILGGPALVALLGVGLLLAKAFAFSAAWVLWPVGIAAIAFALFCAVLSGMNVQ